MNQRVSVIIPVYNEERTLRRCVHSVISQTHENLEIILVDDGSTDASPCICDSYAASDPRIRVIHQENQGLSAARNAGIDIASSPFLQFADSDDYLLPTMTEELLRALLDEDASAAQCGFFVINDALPHDVIKEADYEKTSETYRGEDLFSLLIKHPGATVVQWNKLFRREIFDDLRYPVGKYHEDEFVIHRELANMSSLTCIDSRLYCYVRHPGSITDQITPEKAIHASEAYLDRIRFLAGSQHISHAAATYKRLLKMISLYKGSLSDETGAGDAGKALDRIQAEATQTAIDYIPWEAGVPFDAPERGR